MPPRIDTRASNTSEARPEWVSVGTASTAKSGVVPRCHSVRNPNFPAQIISMPRHRSGSDTRNRSQCQTLFASNQRSRLRWYACPQSRHGPQRSARVVQQLESAIESRRLGCESRKFKLYPRVHVHIPLELSLRGDHARPPRRINRAVAQRRFAPDSREAPHARRLL